MDPIDFHCLDKAAERILYFTEERTSLYGVGTLEFLTKHAHSTTKMYYNQLIDDHKLLSNLAMGCGYRTHALM